MGREPDGELIELIDADPGAFGVPHASTPTRPARERPPLPWKRILIGLGVAGAVTGAVLSVLAWAPWEPDPRLVLADERAYPTELAERLAFDQPTSSVDGVAEAPVDAPVKWNDDKPGYVFAEPGATFQTGDGPDRWFAFRATPADDAPTIFGQRTIAGAPAEVSDESNGAEVRLIWGPIDGMVFDAIASQMKVDDAIALAEQLRIVRGAPVVLDRRALHGVQPLGPLGAYQALLAVQSSSRGSVAAIEHTAAVFYGDGRQSVVSTPAPDTTLAMVEFMFGEKGQQGTVHGLPALGLVHGAGPFGALDRSTVLWWEGGRLVAVTGGSDLRFTFQLAESVRPADDDWWANVARADDSTQP